MVVLILAGRQLLVAELHAFRFLTMQSTVSKFYYGSISIGAFIWGLIYNLPSHERPSFQLNKGKTSSHSKQFNSIGLSFDFAKVVLECKEICDRDGPWAGYLFIYSVVAHNSDRYPLETLDLIASKDVAEAVSEGSMREQLLQTWLSGAHTWFGENMSGLAKMPPPFFDELKVIFQSKSTTDALQGVKEVTCPIEELLNQATLTPRGLSRLVSSGISPIKFLKNVPENKISHTISLTCGMLGNKESVLDLLKACQDAGVSKLTIGFVAGRLAALGHDELYAILPLDTIGSSVHSHAINSGNERLQGKAVIKLLSNWDVKALDTKISDIEANGFAEIALNEAIHNSISLPEEIFASLLRKTLSDVALTEDLKALPAFEKIWPKILKEREIEQALKSHPFDSLITLPSDDISIAVELLDRNHSMAKNPDFTWDLIAKASDTLGVRNAGAQLLKDELLEHPMELKNKINKVNNPAVRDYLETIAISKMSEEDPASALMYLRLNPNEIPSATALSALLESISINNNIDSNFKDLDLKNSETRARILETMQIIE